MCAGDDRLAVADEYKASGWAAEQQQQLAGSRSPIVLEQSVMCS